MSKRLKISCDAQKEDFDKIQILKLKTNFIELHKIYAYPYIYLRQLVFNRNL